MEDTGLDGDVLSVPASWLSEGALNRCVVVSIMAFSIALGLSYQIFSVHHFCGCKYGILTLSHQ